MRRDILNVSHRWAQEKASEEIDAALAKIEEALKTAQRETPDTGKPYVKKRRVVGAAELSGRIYLETQQDVDAFLEKPRQKLEAAIAADERVEIR